MLFLPWTSWAFTLFSTLNILGVHTVDLPWTSWVLTRCDPWSFECLRLRCYPTLNTPKFFSLRKAVYSTCIPWTSWLFVVFLLWTSWMFPLFSYLEHPERYGDPAIQSVLTELEKGDADIDRALVLTETCQKVSKLERAIYILNVKLVCLKRELLFFYRGNTGITVWKTSDGNASATC